MAHSISLPVTVRRTKPHRLLDGLANFKGPMSPEATSRLWAVIENPTSETWERSYALLLRPECMGITLWMAVLCVDPTFPVKGPGSDGRGKRNPWPLVPDQLTIVRAIRYAKSGKMTSAQFRARVGLPPEAR